jgi:large subunit ribosomal protein L3
MSGLLLWEKIIMKFIFGKKMEMTQVYRADGEMVPVTKINAGPCFVMTKKTVEGADKYNAVKCAYQETKKVFNKPQTGIFSKFNDKKYQVVKEVRFLKTDATFDKLKTGDQINVDVFKVGDKVAVTSTSKGKGFQGVVKRHHFKGGKRTHGNKDQERMPGSNGAVQPKHVWKGKRRPGHMGDEQVTVQGLEIVDIDAANNFLYVHGCVPGCRNALVYIKGKGDFEVTVKSVEQPTVEVKAEVKESKKEEGKDALATEATPAVEASKK